MPEWSKRRQKKTEMEKGMDGIIENKQQLGRLKLKHINNYIKYK